MAMRKASRPNRRIFFSRITCRACGGKDRHSSSGLRSLWITNTPPSAIPASGFEFRNTFGSGESTTFTCLSSPFRRTGSCERIP